MQDVVLRATVLAQDGAELTLRVEEVIHPRTPLEAGDQIRVGRHPAHEQHRPGQLTMPAADQASSGETATSALLVMATGHGCPVPPPAAHAERKDPI